MELGRLLTRSGLTHVEVSLLFSPGSLCHLLCSFCILTNILCASIVMKTEIISCEEQIEILYVTSISFIR